MLLDWTAQHPVLTADTAAAYTRRIRGGRSGPSITTLAASGSDNRATTPAASMVGGMTAVLGNASPAQQDAQALHF